MNILSIYSHVTANLYYMTFHSTKEGILKNIGKFFGHHFLPLYGQKKKSQNIFYVPQEKESDSGLTGHESEQIMTELKCLQLSR